MKGFLNYIDGNSLLHKMHPLSKLLLAVSICVATFTTSSYILLGSLILLNLLLGLLGNSGTKIKRSGVFFRTLGLLKGLIKISIFLFVLQVLLIRKGNAVFYIGKFPITDNGLRNGSLLVLRLICATLPLAIMITVTKLSDLSNVLVNNLHIPYKYAFTFTTAIKFIPVFGDEMNNIMEAQKARGVDFDTRNPVKKIALVLPLCVPLLLTSVRKIDSTAVATELRGFHLRKRNCNVKNYPFKFYDIAAILFSAVLIFLGIVLKTF